MSEETQDTGIDQAEAEALAEIAAGYEGKARVEETPAAAETVTETTETEVPAAPSIEDELKALKEKVATLKDAPNADSAVVRKMYGEIGNINRTLQQLQPKAQETAPPADEVDAAIAAAEEVAKEWPELAGPQVAALKALKSALGNKTPTPAFDPNAVTELVDTRVAKERVALHTELLDGLAPDWRQTVGIPDEQGNIPQTPYRSWLATQPQEYQDRMQASNNAFEIKASIEKFAAATTASAKTTQQKQNRLAGAVVSRNTAAPVPSVLPDEAGFEVGYKRADKQLRRI